LFISSAPTKSLISSERFYSIDRGVILLIIIHRINTIKQLRKIPLEYGVEIDVRGYRKKLVLNHEPMQEGDSLEEYLKQYNHSFIIFNIKEAGIEDQVIRLAERYGIKEYFLLDVEFPYIYKATHKDGFKKIAIRYSEAEPIEMALAQKGLLDWVWVDTNTKLPIDKKSYKQFKEAGFKLCLVCPERWGRPEDIPKYKRFIKENYIEFHAVMTTMKYANLWKE